MIDEMPWHELNRDGELTIRSSDPFSRGLETSLRQTLYAWNHVRCDMVVEPYVDISKVIRHSGFGISIAGDTILQGEGNDISSHRYSDQLATEEDLARLRVPDIELDVAATAAVEAMAHECLDGLLDVRMQGHVPWFSMWDDIEQLRSAESILYDLIDRPEFLLAIAERMTDVRLAELDILEEKGLVGYGNDRIHCTGAHTDELPAAGFDAARPRAKDSWTYGMAQLFVSVSDQMWSEMEIPSALRFDSRFGLGYYGCCDPLHDRVKWIRQIPGIRKLSMSAWSNIARGAENIGPDFMFSRKPNPAMVAMDEWVPELAVMDFEDVLEVTKANGCPVDFALKDISTCRSDPRRLWEWSEIAMRMVRG